MDSYILFLLLLPSVLVVLGVIIIIYELVLERRYERWAQAERMRSEEDLRKNPPRELTPEEKRAYRQSLLDAGWIEEARGVYTKKRTFVESRTLH